MSCDEPPPRRARTAPHLAVVLAVLALAGVALAVIGADTVVTDTAGAAPIVDDVSRHDPVPYEVSHDVADEGPSAGQDDDLDARRERCVPSAQAPRPTNGCSPPTPRGPPGD